MAITIEITHEELAKENTSIETLNIEVLILDIIKNNPGINEDLITIRSRYDSETVRMNLLSLLRQNKLKIKEREFNIQFYWRTAQ